MNYRSKFPEHNKPRQDPIHQKNLGNQSKLQENGDYESEEATRHAVKKIIILDATGILSNDEPEEEEDEDTCMTECHTSYKSRRLRQQYGKEMGLGGFLWVDFCYQGYRHSHLMANEKWFDDMAAGVCITMLEASGSNTLR